MNWFNRRAMGDDQTRAIFTRVWGEQDAAKFMNILSLNGLGNIRFELNENLAHPYYSPGAIHCSSRHLQAKWPVLHELGHAYRGQENNLYNLWLCRDFDGTPIPFNDAVKKLLEEEKFATDWANQQIEQYGMEIKPRNFDYPPEIILSILWDIRKKGLETPEQVVEHINNIAASPAPVRKQFQEPQGQLFPIKDKIRNVDRDLDQGWDNAIQNDGE